MFSPVYTLYTYFPLQFFICLFIDLTIIAFGVILAVRLYKKGTFDKSQRAACIILFIWTAIVLFLTVLGRRLNREGLGNYNLELFSCYRMIIYDHSQTILSTTIQNIVMFIPIGFTLSAVFKKKHKLIIPLAISFVLSLVIEVCQLILKSGLFELDDLFNNTLGAFIGILLYLMIACIIRIRTGKEDHIESKDHT